MLSRRLPWIAVLVTLLTAAAALFGPLWDDPSGENPLERETGLEETVGWAVPLGLPTVLVALALVAALALPGRRVLAVVAVVLYALAMLALPGPLTWWFVPAFGLTAVGVVLGMRGARRSDAAVVAD